MAGEARGHGAEVLRREAPAVNAGAKKGVRVHGIVEAQTFDIGKTRAAVFGLGHLPRVIESLEGDIASLRCGLDQLWEGAEGETDPRHNGGPTLDATMAE